MTAADPWAIFRANLESLIKDAGSAEALAADTGISFYTIQSWRNRDVAPQYESLKLVAKTVDLTVEKLVEERIK